MQECENYICPACGSQYFVSSKSTDKTIFQVGFERELIILDDTSGEEIDPLAIHCGACSWAGELTQTSESND